MSIQRRTRYPYRFLCELLLKWAVFFPLVIAVGVALAVMVLGWLGDGTLASLYYTEYFIPLPLYAAVAFVVTVVPTAGLGFISAGAYCTYKFLFRESRPARAI